MRIIGGTHRSRHILPPQGGQTTRPITDRVKQSLFDRLWSMGVFGDEAPEPIVLDIFCGTGSLGLEALSRGAERCTFVENDRSARQRLIRNLDDFDLTDRATVLGVDALAVNWIDTLPHRPADGRGVALIFCDPPYAMTRDTARLARITALLTRLAAVSSEHAVCVLRTDSDTSVSTFAGWTHPQAQLYGSMAVHLCQRAASSSDDTASRPSTSMQ
jgi:16S rRNA (guanine966-N2)-methyltransferase